MSADDERAEQALRTRWRSGMSRRRPIRSHPRRVRDRRVGITAGGCGTRCCWPALVSWRRPAFGVVDRVASAAARRCPRPRDCRRIRRPTAGGPSTTATSASRYRRLGAHVRPGLGLVSSPPATASQSRATASRTCPSAGSPSCPRRLSLDEPAGPDHRARAGLRTRTQRGRVPEERKQGAFWILPRSVSGLLLVVTSKDEALARRIADSIKVRPEPAPCDPDTDWPCGTGPRPGAGRPEPAFDVAAVQDVGSMVICQYESAEEDADAACGRWFGWTLTAPVPSSTRSLPRRSCSPGPVRPRSGGTSLCSSGSRPTGCCASSTCRRAGAPTAPPRTAASTTARMSAPSPRPAVRPCSSRRPSSRGPAQYVGNACLG